MLIYTAFVERMIYEKILLYWSNAPYSLHAVLM